MMELHHFTASFHFTMTSVVASSLRSACARSALAPVRRVTSQRTLGKPLARVTAEGLTFTASVRGQRVARANTIQQRAFFSMGKSSPTMAMASATVTTKVGI
jgi:hypothetical protein